MPDNAHESLSREQRLDEAVTAFLEAQEAGRQPHREEWLARYPEIAAELGQYFADQDEVDRLTVSLRTALQGTPPRRINAKVDRDLEVICLKCLEKEPAQRYRSAEALAEELRSWLRGEPIQARRIGWGHRLWRWCRRKPFLATLIFLLAALALAFVIVLLVSNKLISGHRDEIREKHKLTLERERDLRIHLYASDMRLAWQAWLQGELTRVQELLERHQPQPDEEDLRTFLWHYLRTLLRGLPVARSLEGHRGDVYYLDFSPDGKTLATGGKDGTVRLWDVATGRQRLVLPGDATEVNVVAFSPDGQTLASAGDDGCVHLWNSTTGREQGTFRLHQKEVATVAFSPDFPIPTVSDPLLREPDLVCGFFSR